MTAQLDILSALRGVATAILSDNLDRLPGAVGLRPFHREGMMIGTAFTVRTRAGDNLAIHRAIDAAAPGQVIVVDGGGDDSRALVGEIMMEVAMTKGLAGFVIDGAIRDVDAYAKGDFPCYARSVTHRGPYKTGPGHQQVPVSVGGMPVLPGDIVIGDADGVIALSHEEARRILPAVLAQIDREAEVIASIRAGTYQGSYGKPAS